MMTPTQIRIRQEQRRRHPELSVCPVCGDEFWATVAGLTPCCQAQPVDVQQPDGVAVAVQMPVTATQAA